MSCKTLVVVAALSLVSGQDVGVNTDVGVLGANTTGAAEQLAVAEVAEVSAPKVGGTQVFHTSTDAFQKAHASMKDQIPHSAAGFVRSAQEASARQSAKMRGSADLDGSVTHDLSDQLQAVAVERPTEEKVAPVGVRSWSFSSRLFLFMISASAAALLTMTSPGRNALVTMGLAEPECEFTYKAGGPWERMKEIPLVQQAAVIFGCLAPGVSAYDQEYDRPMMDDEEMGDAEIKVDMKTLSGKPLKNVAEHREPEKSFNPNAAIVEQKEMPKMADLMTSMQPEHGDFASDDFFDEDDEYW